MREAPSDRLEDLYDLRAELEYAEGVEIPDPSIDRKYEVVHELVVGGLPCEAFLDAGCGDGRHLAALAEIQPRPARIVGVDIAQRMLVTARATAQRSGVEAELIRANLEALPLEDASFDLVLCTQVLEHLLDPAAGLRELARVLRPEGRLIVTTDNRWNLVTKVLNVPRSALVRLLGLRGRRKRVQFPHASFRVREFVSLVRAAGLEPEHVRTFRFHLDSPLGPERLPGVQRALNRLDRALPRHRVGDLIAVVARRAAG